MNTVEEIIGNETNAKKILELLEGSGLFIPSELLYIGLVLLFL